MVTKNKCIVICWFLVGFIASKIIFGSFEVAVGIGYIFYPFMALFLFAASTDSGKQEFMDQVSQILGVLAVIYILIPVVVEAIYNKMKK